MNRTSFIVKVEIECMYILKGFFFRKKSFHIYLLVILDKEKTSLISNIYNATLQYKYFSDLTNVYGAKHGVYKKRGFITSLFLAFGL